MKNAMKHLLIWIVLCLLAAACSPALFSARSDEMEAEVTPRAESQRLQISAIRAFSTVRPMTANGSRMWRGL